MTERKCGAIFETNPSETLGINPENGAAIRRISDSGMKQYGRADMKLSTKGRYGLRAMVDLAVYSEKESVSISCIAQRENISESYLEQLAGKLKKAGLIKSTRGAQGGYRLAKPAAEISVGDILRALEGELGAVDCQGLKPEGGCESSDFCVTKLVWQRINDSIAKAVDEITLEELMAEAKKSQERKREMEQSGQYINSQDKADTKRKC